MAKAKSKKVSSKKNKKVVIGNIGKAYINSTYNNTFITITNFEGDSICWSTPGAVGFTGTRAATPYAATIAAESAAKKAIEKGLQTVDIVVKGAGSTKISAIKGIRSAGLKVLSIRDVTPIPYNGCRPRKKRRN